MFEVLQPYFNRNWYEEFYPDIGANAIDPLLHFKLFGSDELRNPNPYFDVKWYLEQYPEAGFNSIDALTHFVANGMSGCFNPNPFFDVEWYITQHWDLRESGTNPLLHYIEIGQYQDADPSATFDTAWYRGHNPDLIQSTLSPFDHFLRHGIAEGRKPCPNFSEIRPAHNAHILCIKAPELFDEVALLVTHSPDGKFKPHVRHYIASLKRQKIDVVLIAASDVPFCDLDLVIQAGVAGAYIRENTGYDFAAWAHIIHLRPDILEKKCLYLLNDSVIGPFSDRAFKELLEKLEQDDGDILGLTDSYELAWHIQSYFLLLKAKALKSEIVHRFFSTLVCYSNKQSVIDKYELKWAQIFSAARLKCHALFPAEPTFNDNPHIYRWQSLIADGFPFIKMTTVRDYHPAVDVSNWRKLVKSKGYDVSLVEPMLKNPARVWR